MSISLSCSAFRLLSFFELNSSITRKKQLAACFLLPLSLCLFVSLLCFCLCLCSLVSLSSDSLLHQTLICSAFVYQRFHVRWRIHGRAMRPTHIPLGLSSCSFSSVLKKISIFACFAPLLPSSTQHHTHDVDIVLVNFLCLGTAQLCTFVQILMFTHCLLVRHPTITLSSETMTHCPPSCACRVDVFAFLLPGPAATPIHSSCIVDVLAPVDHHPLCPCGFSALLAVLGVAVWDFASQQCETFQSHPPGTLADHLHFCLLFPSPVLCFVACISQIVRS